MAKTRKRKSAAPAPPDPPVQVDGADERTAPRGREATPGAPDPDRIARRAYELYRERGEVEGGALEDWLAAEQELNRSTSDDRDE